MKNFMLEQLFLKCILCVKTLDSLERHISNNIMFQIDYKGIYSILEKVFIFSECTVGVAQQASFRIQNLGKVPCEVYVQLRCKVKGIGLSTKDIDKMLTERIDKAGKEVEKPFDLLSPAKMSVQPQESEFVFVRFTPSALQVIHPVNLFKF